jgi:RNA ligase (TIGR02306 family)
VFEGIEGEKLRTIRLRGQVSQGLLLPVHDAEAKALWGVIIEGDDVSELLGIQKWEAPLSAQLAGTARGNFPSRIIKTDQERVQNLTQEFSNGKIAQNKYEISEKLEGSSCTYYIMDDVFGVCSRNLDLKEVLGNSFWDVARRDGIEEKLRLLGYDVAVQGELIGPGIQDNIYKLNRHEFYLFDIQFVGAMKYQEPIVRRIVATGLGIKHVPVIEIAAQVGTIQEVIAMADGKSAINPAVNREGIVFKANSENRFSFKAISNAYLVKQKD